MPMLGSGLAALLQPEIKTQIQAVFTITDADKLDQFATAMANAIGNKVVDYIKANAVVTVNVASVTGVTTGPGVSGPGTGTGTIG